MLFLGAKIFSDFVRRLCTSRVSKAYRSVDCEKGLGLGLLAVWLACDTVSSRVTLGESNGRLESRDRAFPVFTAALGKLGHNDVI